MGARRSSHIRDLCLQLLEGKLIVERGKKVPLNLIAPVLKASAVKFRRGSSGETLCQDWR